MSSVIQYDLFSPKPTEVEELRIELAAVKKSADKVRRGTYASINELRKENVELRNMVDLLVRNICKNEITLSQS